MSFIKQTIKIHWQKSNVNIKHHFLEDWDALLNKEGHIINTAINKSTNDSFGNSETLLALNKRNIKL